MPNNLIIGSGKAFSKPEKIKPIIDGTQNPLAIHLQIIDNYYDEIEKLEKKIKKKPSSIQVPALQQRINQLKRIIRQTNNEYRKWNEPNSLVPKGKNIS